MARPIKTPFEEEVTQRPTRATDRPEFVGGKPKMPKHLSPEARMEWKRCVKLMAARATITPGDAALLELYATVYSRWVSAKAQMGDELMVTYFVLSSTGQPVEKKKVNPLLAICQKSEVEIRTLAAQLGLAPVTRAHVVPTRTNIKDGPAPGTVGWTLLHPGE